MTDDDRTEPAPTPTPFHDLDQYVAIPRMSGLALSPDGRRLLTTVTTLNPKRTGYASALWQIDTTGERVPHRLTRSAAGEQGALFTAAGDVLFTSSRPDVDPVDKPVSALWLLPAVGGEARVIASAPGGLGGVLAAASAPVVSVAADLLPSATDLDHDATLRQARTDLEVSAILHTGYPVRHWDHDLGPAAPHRFVGDLTALVDEPARPVPASTPDPVDSAAVDSAPADPARLRLRDILGGAGLREHHADLSADGTTLVTTWEIPGPKASTRTILVAVDTATGERRTLVDDPGADLHSPAISPDGSQVVFIRETHSCPDTAPEQHLALVALREEDPHPRSLASTWDRWPTSVCWLPDGSGLLVTADHDGRGPVFLVTLGATPVVERVTSDDATFTDVVVGPDGAVGYALRTSYWAPAHPVRIDLAAFRASGPAGERSAVSAVALPSPVPSPELPGILTEVEAPAADDVRVRGWLALPHGASAQNPAPLLLWIHGGPLGSWNAWSWRWNPWLAVARGYAVLLPDPALSTGYGQDFIQRGWGSWGSAPFTDLMAITDHVVDLPEIDAERTAAMGGSFGGYMANWVAGHTDRFRAIVTHASLWALDQFGPTTDHSFYWRREMTPQMAAENSPHRHVGDIRTPMLVVHGDRDYRVPIGEGLRLWYELLADSGLPADEFGRTVHRFLYFPSENHWVLSPQHAKIWYEVVFAFLADHVPGMPAHELPEALG